jgi:SAM-dependent methyltransferase
VLEHIPNPEMALAEMRRILKPNGLLLLWPAWRVSPLAARGYHSRPYRDFDVGGKLIKASIGLRTNYAQYWEADSDAVNSLDRYETYLWFKSRGDLCLNCTSDWDILRTQETQKMYLVIRVKPTSR